MEIAVLIWIACGIVAAIIGSGKGEGCAGFILGVVLGPIGILLALASSGNRRACPYCKEMIHREALVCPRCQRDLPISPVSTPTPVPPSPAVSAAARAAGRAVARAFNHTEITTIIGIVGVGALLLYLYVR